YLFSIIISVIGLFMSPVFAYAGYDCYVDADADSGGDGSESAPYTKISKALEEGCREIYVKEGNYSDAITLGNDVKIRGESRDKAIIKGKITMKNGSQLEKVGIQSGGVYVDKDANAKIAEVDIKGAATGVETYGKGKLTVEKTKIYGNGKGFYIQAGKSVSIKSSEIYDNLEEGIDIRANVDGIISGNIIEDNGESGIEVILGKAELKISNNKIKNNGSSGIATQFYDHADNLGDLEINSNIISGNKNYAVDCKLPSGGSPTEGYWTNSLTLIGNTISGNKSGDFASKCKLGTLKIDNATKTKEEIEAEEKAKQEALEKYKEAPGEILGDVKVLETNTGYLNLREGPTMDYNIVGTLKTGEEYGYSVQENGWYKVSVSDSLWGWASGAFLEEIIKEEPVEEPTQENIQEETEVEPTLPVEISGQSDNENDEEKKDYKNLIIAGITAGTALLLIILLFSPLADRIFKKKEKEFVFTENKDFDGDRY
ncbi:MAG: right-handed parallel beta-helix repeat-containing protein, partial [Candidatus Moranbacteria bacterium]|nr:right-handed parallel beta-helix repeat-containing protein [Candidatus Moranbacteria bacterium]